MRGALCFWPACADSDARAAHDDALRVFFARMREYDVPEEELVNLPVGFLAGPLAVGPAGLVARPSVA